MEEALDTAMFLFWEKGYEGTSLAELCEAMGITKPSLYAAFDNKETLFEMALTRYAAGPNAFYEKAFSLPTARQVAEALLQGAVNVSTLNDGPKGCLNTLATLAQTGCVRDGAADRRNRGEQRLEKRFREARKVGELPRSTDCAALARYVSSVGFGITVQGASGQSREALHGVAKLAMTVWPSQDTSGQKTRAR